MKNSLFIISKLCMLAFILLLAQGCQEDYEMIDPPLMTDYDDDLDEEVIMQKGLESYFVTQFGEGEMDGDRKSTRLNSSHPPESRMPSSA